MYAEGTDLGYNNQYSEIWPYFGTSFLADGNASYNGNVQDLVAPYGSFARGLDVGYLYRENPDNYVDEFGANGGTIVYEDQSQIGRVVSYNHSGYRTICSSVIFGAMQGANRDRLMAAYVRFLLTGAAIEDRDLTELPGNSDRIPRITTPVRSGFLTIHLNPRFLDSSNPLSVSIFDASGRPILHSAICTLTFEMPLDLPAGTYFCRLTAKGSTYSLPFIVIR